MDVQTFAGFGHSLQTLAFTAIILTFFYFFPKINYQAHLARLPSYGGSTTGGEKQRKAYLSSAKKMYTEGYMKVRLCNLSVLHGIDKAPVQR